MTEFMRGAVSDECRRSEHDGYAGERSGCTGVGDVSGIVCDCECHGMEPGEAPEAIVSMCTCRSCGEMFENPYAVGESYLCDSCIAKPVAQEDIDRMRREP